MLLKSNKPLGFLNDFFKKTSPVERRTLFLDHPRFVLQGILDIEFKNYAAVVAISVFSMSHHAKGLIASASYIGMALSPLILALFTTKMIALETNRVIALLLSLVGMALVVAAVANCGLVFLIAIVFAKILYKQTLPFVTDIYNRNYPKKRRGRIIGYLFTILALSSVISGVIFGHILDRDLNNYRWIFVLGAFAAFFCSAIFRHIPNGHVLPANSQSLLRSNLSILFHDRLFTAVLLLWSLMSIAFQMTYPLRIEYLTNPQYGLCVLHSDYALLMITIPTTVRILSAFFWGRIFDTQNFAVMKILINAAFLLGIPLFFFSTNFWVLALSSVFLGLGYGGNLTAWQLWVTKIVPSPEKLGAYVSLDMAIMGLRDAIAASLGYFLLAHSFSLHGICVLSIVLVAISILGFYFLIPQRRMQ